MTYTNVDATDYNKGDPHPDYPTSFLVVEKTTGDPPVTYKSWGRGVSASVARVQGYRKPAPHEFNTYATYPECPAEYTDVDDESSVTFTRALAEFQRLGAIPGDTGRYVTPMGKLYEYLYGDNGEVTLLTDSIPTYEFTSNVDENNPPLKSFALASSDYAKGFRWNEDDLRTGARKERLATADGVAKTVWEGEVAGAAAVVQSNLDLAMLPNKLDATSRCKMTGTFAVLIFLAPKRSTVAFAASSPTAAADFKSGAWRFTVYA